MLDFFINTMSEITGLSKAANARILVSLGIIALLWIIRTVVIKIIWNHTEEPVARYRWRKIVGYSYLLVSTIVLIRVWFVAARSLDNLFAFLSAGLTAGLAIALQDVIKSFAGWLMIIWRHPFKAGDRIEIDNGNGQTVSGDVIDIRPFKFSMVEIGNWVDADQSTGRVIHVPNSYVLTGSIINYGEGFEFIWNEVPVLLTFESDWKEAKALMTKIANKHAKPMTAKAKKKIKEASKKYMIFYKNITPIVYTSVKDSGVLLTMRYLVEPRQRRGSEEKIWEDILTAFGTCNNIDFAYPTQRFFNNPQEGKHVLHPVE